MTTLNDYAAGADDGLSQQLSIAKSALAELDTYGYCLVKNFIAADDLQRLLQATQALRHDNPAHGVRNLLQKAPAIKHFMASAGIRMLIETVLSTAAAPVRSIYFDKNPQANWNVAWHQDTMIAVNTKGDLPGFGPWSTKSGVVHVQPPVEILQTLVTMRIHLDDTDAHNGALRVLPGSHRRGRVPTAEIFRLFKSGAVATCTAQAGDVLLMRPLLIHSSRKSRNPNHRRIIHVEFSSVSLPSPLQWHGF